MVPVQEWERRAGQPLTDDEQRELRRNAVVSAGIGAVLTVVLLVVAVARVAGHDSAPTAVLVLGVSATSTPDATTVAPTTVVATTQPQPKPKARPKPTTPKLVVLPPFTGFPTTTTTSSTTTTTTTTTTPPTTVAKVPRIVWSANPSSATVQTGGLVTISVTAANFGNWPGLVTAPGCPGTPQPFANAPRAAVCAQGNQVVRIEPGQLKTWTVKVQATKDATRLGKPLAPGRYKVMVGGATVVLNVVP